MGTGPASPLPHPRSTHTAWSEPQPLTLLVLHLPTQEPHLWVTSLKPGWQSKYPGAQAVATTSFPSR